jgi:hypothetical protein
VSIKDTRSWTRSSYGAVNGGDPTLPPGTDTTGLAVAGSTATFGVTVAQMTSFTPPVSGGVELTVSRVRKFA